MQYEIHNQILEGREYPQKTLMGQWGHLHRDRYSVMYHDHISCDNDILDLKRRSFLFLYMLKYLKCHDAYNLFLNIRNSAPPPLATKLCACTHTEEKPQIWKMLSVSISEEGI